MLSLLVISCTILRPLTTTFEVLLTLKFLSIILSLKILIYFQMFSRASSDFYLKRKNRNLHFLGSSEFVEQLCNISLFKIPIFCLAALGLSCGTWDLWPSLWHMGSGAWDSLCGGSSCGTQALGNMGFSGSGACAQQVWVGTPGHRLSHCSTWARLPHGLWSHHGLGIKLLSHALQGGLLTTDHQRSPLICFF